MPSRCDIVLESLEGKTILITALNVDIANSSEQIKGLSAEQAAEYYQRFIETVSDLIQHHGGHVLKNVGDCVIGFFLSGWPIVENYDDAVRCGLEVFHMLDNNLNPYLVKKGIPAIKCRVSADFGKVRVIKINSQYGYSTFDLFGTPMNTSTKISHFAKPNQMVIGDNLFWRLVDNDGIDFELLIRWDIRGKYTYPVYLVNNK